MIRVSLFLLGSFGLLVVGCQRLLPITVSKVRIFKLIGEVRSVNAEQGRVTIRHEAIPGFMDAMTMPFTLKNKALLDDVRPGDEVEGELRVVFEGKNVQDYELTDLVVTRPAPGPALTLHMATDGTATLSPVPKRLTPGEPVPDFTITTQDGQPLKLSDLRGQVVALTFIYTRCPLPDFCPAQDRKFAELASLIGMSPERASRVRLLSISFDPEHDTPEVLRKHAELLGARPPLWTFAVAAHDELFKVAAPLGLTYGPREQGIDHNLTVAVIDPEGKLARLETGKDWRPADLLKTIAGLVPTADGGPRER